VKVDFSCFFAAMIAKTCSCHSISLNYRIYSSITRTINLKIGIHFFYFFSAQTQTEHNIYVATSMSSFMLQHFVLLHHRA